MVAMTTGLRPQPLPRPIPLPSCDCEVSGEFPRDLAAEEK